MDHLICNYSDLPSPWAYMIEEEKPRGLLPWEIERVLEMAWEDRTPFDAIRNQFGLTESAVRKLMQRELRFSSYKRWRERVEACRTKHSLKRNEAIKRFKSKQQRVITSNRISKRR